MSIFSTAYIPDENGELTALDGIGVQLAEAGTQMGTGDIGAAFFKMLLSLVVIVALLVVSYWFLRKIIQNRLQKGSEDSSIKILEKRVLSPKTMLYLVEMDQKKVLIAESHLEVKKIQEL